MRNWTSIVVGALALTFAAANVCAQTVGTIPKYVTGGTFGNSVIVESNGNIGISAATDSRFRVVASGLVDFYGPVASIYFADLSYGGVSYAKIQGANPAASAAAPIVMQPDGGNVVLGLIASTKVGINNPSPNSTLDVVGTINASGNITSSGTIAANYQDVAEWVPATEQLSSGTVVVLNRTNNNEVTASSKAYDTAVAGVVSEHPGIVLGRGGEGEAQVATTGRVRVKVDATQSRIEIGDLLVTSGIRGMAMKSIPVDLGGVSIHRPGTIIGKALEPLDSGTGEILVLLSLQ